MGKILVAAIVLVMAGPASAQTSQWVGPVISGGLSASRGECSDNNGGVITGPCGRLAPFPHCLPGWTLVVVGTAANVYTPVNKCAAVGDLRDPE